MRKLWFIAFLILSGAPLAEAQSDSSRAELFAGYSILQTDYKVKESDAPVPAMLNCDKRLDRVQ